MSDPTPSHPEPESALEKLIASYRNDLNSVGQFHGNTFAIELMAQARLERAKLVEALEMSHEALKDSECQGEGGFWEEAACPVCGASAYDRKIEVEHEKNCTLNNSMKAIEALLQTTGKAGR